MSGALSVRSMAAALKVSKSQVQRDARDGMPMHDVSAAIAWRRANRDPARQPLQMGIHLARTSATAAARRERQASPVAPGGVEAVQAVADAHGVALAWLDRFGELGPCEGSLRAALRRVPGDAVHLVRLDERVADLLIGPAWLAWLEREAEAETAAGPALGGLVEVEGVDTVVQFLHLLCCGDLAPPESGG